MNRIKLILVSVLVSLNAFTFTFDLRNPRDVKNWNT